MKTYVVSSGSGYVKINDASFHNFTAMAIKKGDDVVAVINGENVARGSYTQFLNGDDSNASFDSADDLITFLNSVFSVGGGDGYGVTAATVRESNTVLFDSDYITGSGGARTGDVLIDETGGKSMAVTTMLHNDSSAPDFFESDGTTPFVFSVSTGFYAVDEDNYLDIQYLWNGNVRITISN